MHKLFNLPSVNVITIPEAQERISLLKDEFKFYGINDITVNTYKKYKKDDYIFQGEYADLLADSHRGVLSSHLISIKKWYNNTNEEYAIFCEDDLSLKSVEYWTFDWSSFFNALPKNWGCIQMVLVKETGMTDYDLSFRKRNWDDWSTCCFMMKRSYAKKILDFYFKNEIFTLTYRGLDEHQRKIANNNFWLIPSNETILYSLVEPVYVVPLFTENINFQTTTNLFLNEDQKIHQALGHVESNKSVMDWWKTKGLLLNDVKNYPDHFG